MKKKAIKLLSTLLLSTFVFTNLQVATTAKASEKDDVETTKNNVQLKDNPLSEEDLKEIGKYKNLLDEDGDTDNLGVDEKLNHSITSPIVILIKFKGQTDEEAYSQSEINSIKEAFSGKTKSMKDYLEKASYGQCGVNPIFTFEQGSNLFIYEAPYTKEYYSPYDEYSNPIGYHEKTERHQLLIDAFASIKDKLPDDIDYDVNKDGYYDGVDFFIPEETEWNSFLWPHKWSVYDSKRDTEKNGCIMQDYNVITKRYFSSADYKVITHEYLHTLGYPDFYVYDNAGSFNNPMDDWSIMSTTTGFQSVYERMAYSNWISKSDIKTISNEGTYTLDNAAMEPKNHNIAYKIEVPNSNQYFMIEYRDKSANVYTQDNTKSGIVTYRIDDSRNGNSNGDPEIYTLRNDEKTVMDDKSESMKLVLSSGQETGYKVQYVEEKDGQASFKLIKYTPVESNIKINSIDVSSEGFAQTYTVNIDNSSELNLRYTYYSIDKNDKETVLTSNSYSNVYTGFINNNERLKVVVSDGNGGIGIAYTEKKSIKIIDSISIDKGTNMKLLDTAKIHLNLAKPEYKEMYTFNLYARLGDINEILIDNVSDLDATWKPKQTGKYTIEAVVTNEASQIIDKTEIEVNVTDDMLINMSQNSPVEPNDSITLTAKSSDPLGKYKYRFSVILDGKKEFLSIFSTKNTVIWTPKSTGRYAVVFEMIDSNNKITKRTVNYDVVAMYPINYIDGMKSNIVLGEEISAVVNTRYTDDYTYSMEATYYSGKVEETVEVVKESSSNVLKWIPENIGEYGINIYLKYKGTIIEQRYFNLTVTGNIKPKIITDMKSPQNINTPIMINASSEGSGKYKYRCLLYKDGKLQAGSSYMDNINIKWIPKYTGNYIIKVQAMDSNGHVESSTSEYNIKNKIEITDIGINDGDNIEFLGTSTKININIKAKGGDGDNRYYLIIEDLFSNQAIMSNSEENSCIYILDNYVSEVKVKAIVLDKNGNFDVAYKKVSVLDISPTLNISPDKVALLGNTFKLNAEPYNKEDGNKYRYAIAYGEQFDGDIVFDEEKYLNDFNDNSSFDWMPDKEGEYKVIVEVKDKNNKISRNSDYVSVRSKDNVIVNKINVISTNNMAVNSPIKISPEVISNGKITKIEYTIYNIDKNKYVGRVVSTKEYVIWIPKESGQYTVSVVVYNEYNNMSQVQDYFEVNNTVTINSFTSDKEGSQKVGTDITFSTKASGEGDLYYRYLIYKDGELVKQTAYLDKSECTYTPKVAGEYVIKVKVKNQLGIMVSKTMKITID